MTVFSDKLSRIPETIAAVASSPVGDIRDEFRSGRGRHAAVVGSGGSIVAAEFFARCRSTLGLGPTSVLTPMEFVVAMDGWTDCDVWLLSAGGDNPDIFAAYTAAVRSDATRIRLLTVRDDGRVAAAARLNERAKTYVVPVVDPKDGFLATHSMAATITTILIACDGLTEVPRGRALVDAFTARATSILTSGSELVEAVSPFRRGDTVVILHDPQLATLASLLETSLWETGIAPVQRTDFRNFAHGRHVWAARYPESMFILALTTGETADVWTPIRDALPASVRSGTSGFGNAGRLRNALGAIDGLAAVRAMGEVAGIDPGRPGHGPFAAAIYGDASLETLSADLSRSVRHKTAAHLSLDPVHPGAARPSGANRGRLQRFSGVSFFGVALDYDGTIVPTEGRLAPPAPELIAELSRIIDGGCRLGIATGRGGSAGEMLRDALPERMHRLVTMGYYNGAHLRTLDVDIRSDQPTQDPSIVETAAWIENASLLRPGCAVKPGRVQVSIQHRDVVCDNFLARMSECGHVAEGRILLRASHHSYDLVATGVSKLKVVEALAAASGRPGAPVLTIGDSGSPLGNDYELLSAPYGLSVDSVCGDLDGCWAPFGTRLTGPAALLRILRALRSSRDGTSLDVAALEIDAA